MGVWCTCDRAMGSGMSTGAKAPGRPKNDGDLYARVRIVVPEQSSAEEQALYEKLAELSDFDPRSG